MDYDKINFHQFVDDKLGENNFRITNVTEALIKERLVDFKKFVNDIIEEYAEAYDWKKADDVFFLKPMVDKWKFSFAILDEKDNICFLNFSSVYGDIIHNHCTFAGKQTRSKNFAKLHIIKLCQTGIDSGFTFQEGYWPKNNNRSIILFLKMGWQITHIRDNKQLGMKADLIKVRNQTYDLVISGK